MPILPQGGPGGGALAYATARPYFAPLPVGPTWTELRGPLSWSQNPANQSSLTSPTKALTRARSLPNVNERWVDTVEAYSPFSKRSPVHWHEQLSDHSGHASRCGALVRQQRRAAFDKKRRARRARALEKVSKIVEGMQRIANRFMRANLRTGMIAMKAFTEDKRNVEAHQDFTMKQALREKRVSTMLLAGGDHTLRFAWIGWKRFTEDERERKQDETARQNMPMEDRGDRYLERMRSNVQPRQAIKLKNLDDDIGFDSKDESALERNADTAIMSTYHIPLEDFDCAKRYFNEIDEDKNGYVDRREFEQLICKLFGAKDKFDIPQSRMAMYWSFCDTSRTGKVTFINFVIWWNKHGKTIGDSSLSATLRVGSKLPPRVQFGGGMM